LRKAGASLPAKRGLIDDGAGRPSSGTPFFGRQPPFHLRFYRPSGILPVEVKGMSSRIDLPALHLERLGWINARWGTSDNNRA
jgi:hypothetical protein